MRPALWSIVAAVMAGCSPAAPPPAPASAPSAFPAVLEARGTEPFWALEVNDRAMILRRPDGDATHPAPRRSETAGSATFESQGWRLTVTSGPCSDGMSDRTYEFTAKATIDGAALDGCADRLGVRGER